MQVYKVFLRILMKQKFQILMYLMIFLGVGMIMSSQAVSNPNGTYEAYSHKLAIFDEDRSELSRGMVKYLSEGNEVVELGDDDEAIQDGLYNRSVHCVIRIPKGYGSSLADGGEPLQTEVTSLPGTIYVETFKSMVSRYSSIAAAYQAGGMDPQSVAEQTAKTCQEKVKVTLSDKKSEGTHGALYYFFAYFPYIFISISVVGIGPILIVFHKKEVRDRNVCSSYPLIRSNIELYTGMVTTEIGFCLCYCLMVMFGMKSAKALFCFQGLLYCMNMLCFMVVTLGIVFLVGQVVKKSSALSMVSNIIGLGMSFLCGVFVPLEYLGEGLIKAVHFLPAYWYIVSATWIDHYVPGKDLSGLWGGLGIQLLFGIGFLCAGLAYSRAKVSANESK